MKTILLLGSSGALGSSIYDKLTAVGYSVICADCVKVKNINYFFNATNVDSVENLFNRLAMDGQQIDCVINLVGKIHSKPFYNVMEKDRYIDDDIWDDVILHNLKSAFNISREYHKYCTRLKLKCNLVNFSSVTARGNPGQLIYSVSKAGVETLTKTLAKELGVRGHRFNVISPGYIDVASTRQAISDEQAAKIKSRIPSRKFGDTGSIVEAVKMLIEASYVNGAVIAVDGGYTI